VIFFLSTETLLEPLVFTLEDRNTPSRPPTRARPKQRGRFGLVLCHPPPHLLSLKLALRDAALIF